MGGGPCYGRIIGFRAHLFVPSPPTFGGAQRVRRSRILRMLSWTTPRCGTSPEPHGSGDRPIHSGNLLLDFTLTKTMDRFIWKWTALGEFSSASAYQALLFGRSSLLGASHLWKTQAPGRVRFFGWLVLHGLCWTSDRL
jgi:hypothetical protein